MPKNDINLLEHFEKKVEPNFLRNFIFGAEDSLVSTFGVLIGITAVSSFTKEQIIAAGLITIVVEATSMGAGSFLSESSQNEVEANANNKIQNPILDGVVMFFSYFFAGFIPLAPYLFFNIGAARYASIAITLTSLFILGYLPAKKPRSGLKMAVVAGVAALLGYLVAYFFSV